MPSSILARHLLRMFAMGELTATNVQSIAEAAELDGWRPDDKLGKRLAAAGERGLHSGNVSRDVVRAARLEGMMASGAQPYKCKIPGGLDFSIFLPHEILKDFARVETEDALMEHDTFLADLVKTWTEHPDVMLDCDDKTKVIVAGLHCDGVSYTSSVRAGEQRSILAASINVLSASERLRNRRMPLFVLPKRKLCTCGCQGYCTFQAIFKIISWSFQSLCAATMPTCRHDGTEWSLEDIKHGRGRSQLEAVPRSGLLQIRGDWEFYEQAFRFRAPNAEEFCWLCQTTKKDGPLSFRNFGPEAPHRCTTFGHCEYLAQCAEEMVQPPTIFESPGTCLEHVSVDGMHAGDLGPFQDAIGSLIWTEIANKAWHKSKAKGLVSVNAALKQYYDANKHRGFSEVRLTEAQVLSSEVGYPYLKAKAAQTRHMAEFALALAHKHAGHCGRPKLQFPVGHHLEGREDEHLAYLVSMFEGLVNYQKACSSVPFVVQPCKEGLYLFLNSLGKLHTLWREGVSAEDGKVQPFHLRPKCHMLQHLAEDKLCLWGSPSRSWCYRDEDYVGAIKKMAARTKYPSTLEQRIFEKLQILAGLDSHL